MCQAWRERRRWKAGKKIILFCSPSRLGAIINKPPEAVSQTRAGKQQWLCIQNDLHCHWCYLSINQYHKVYPQSSLGFSLSLIWKRTSIIVGKWLHIYGHIYKVRCHSHMTRPSSTVTREFCTQYTSVLDKIVILSLSLSSPFSCAPNLSSFKTIYGVEPGKQATSPLVLSTPLSTEGETNVRG